MRKTTCWQLMTTRKMPKDQLNRSRPRLMKCTRQNCARTRRWTLMTWSCKRSSCLLRTKRLWNITNGSSNIFTSMNTRIPTKHSTAWSGCSRQVTGTSVLSGMPTRVFTAGVARTWKISWTLKKIIQTPKSWNWNKITARLRRSWTQPMRWSQITRTGKLKLCGRKIRPAIRSIITGAWTPMMKLTMLSKISSRRFANRVKAIMILPFCTGPMPSHVWWKKHLWRLTFRIKSSGRTVSTTVKKFWISWLTCVWQLTRKIPWALRGSWTNLNGGSVKPA